MILDTIGRCLVACCRVLTVVTRPPLIEGVAPALAVASSLALVGAADQRGGPGPGRGSRCGGKKKFSQCRDLNTRPEAYETPALPLSYIGGSEDT